MRVTKLVSGAVLITGACAPGTSFHLAEAGHGNPHAAEKVRSAGQRENPFLHSKNNPYAQQAPHKVVFRQTFNRETGLPHGPARHQVVRERSSHFGTAAHSVQRAGRKALQSVKGLEEVVVTQYKDRTIVKSGNEVVEHHIGYLEQPIFEDDSVSRDGKINSGKTKSSILSKHRAKVVAAERELHKSESTQRRGGHESEDELDVQSAELQHRLQLAKLEMQQAEQQAALSHRSQSQSQGGKSLLDPSAHHLEIKGTPGRKSEFLVHVDEHSKVMVMPIDEHASPAQGASHPLPTMAFDAYGRPMGPQGMPIVVLPMPEGPQGMPIVVNPMPEGAEQEMTHSQEDYSKAMKKAQRAMRQQRQRHQHDSEPESESESESEDQMPKHRRKQKNTRRQRDRQARSDDQVYGSETQSEQELEHNPFNQDEVLRPELVSGGRGRQAPQVPRLQRQRTGPHAQPHSQFSPRLYQTASGAIPGEVNVFHPPTGFAAPMTHTTPTSVTYTYHPQVVQMPQMATIHSGAPGGFSQTVTLHPMNQGPTVTRGPATQLVPGAAHNVGGAEVKLIDHKAVNREHAEAKKVPAENHELNRMKEQHQKEVRAIEEKLQDLHEAKKAKQQMKQQQAQHQERQQAHDYEEFAEEDYHESNQEGADENQPKPKKPMPLGGKIAIGVGVALGAVALLKGYQAYDHRNMTDDEEDQNATEIVDEDQEASGQAGSVPPAKPSQPGAPQKGNGAASAPGVALQKGMPAMGPAPANADKSKDDELNSLLASLGLGGGGGAPPRLLMETSEPLLSRSQNLQQQDDNGSPFVKWDLIPEFKWFQ